MPPSSSGSVDERTCSPGMRRSEVICSLYVSLAMSSATRSEIGMICARPESQGRGRQGAEAPERTARACRGAAGSRAARPPLAMRA